MTPDLKPHPKEQDYWRYSGDGFPKKIWWKVIAGPGKLSILQEYDLIFDQKDLRIRKLI